MSTLAKVTFVLLVVAATGLAWRLWSPNVAPPVPSAGTPAAKTVGTATPSATDWRLLFDGSTLDGWKPAEMMGSGKVHVRDRALVLEGGDPMSGVVYAHGDFPTVDYEVAWEGRRVDGEDFFCTAVFPFDDRYCSFVTGGWGGSIVGLSNINYDNASANVTTNSREFERGRWYSFRLRVVGERIVAWIDDERVVNLDAAGMHVDVHRACVPCKPFGLTSYKTTGEVRNIRVRRLNEAEKNAPAAANDGPGE